MASSSSHFSDSLLEVPGSGWFALGARTLLCVSGPDARRFLNGQCSANTLNLGPGVALPACVLNAKGKLVALVGLWESQQDVFFVESEIEVRESLLNRLDRYLVSDAAEIVDQTGTMHAYHVLGGSKPQLPEGSFVIENHRFGQPGFDCWVPSGVQPGFLTPALVDTEVERLRILSLRPCWGKELSEDTLPAEAGLDRFAVDFHKGCYMGQEVVSRIRSVGRVNRKLVRWVAAGPESPKEGGRIFVSDESDQPVGWITSAMFHPESTLGLAYLHRDAMDLKSLVAETSTEETVGIAILS
jgi:folate-binding protein YgfZ